MFALNDSTFAAVLAAALVAGPALSGCLGPPGGTGPDGKDGNTTEYIGSCPPAGTIPRQDPGANQTAEHATQVPGDTSFPPPSETDPALALDPLVSNRSTTAGGTVAFPLTVGPNATQENYEAVAPEVLDAGGWTTRSTGAAPLGPNGTGFFLHVKVPEDAQDGVHNVTVRARADDVAGPATTLQVHVGAPEKTVDSGEKAQVDYVGRFVNGTVFATSHKDIDQSPIPKAGFYQGGGPYQPLNVTVGPQPQFIKGFNDGLIGLGVGDDATFLVPPSQGYGNETTVGSTKRNLTINRTITQQRTFNLSRPALERQGLINKTHEQGETITVGQGPSSQVYKITFLNETKVELTLQVEEGETTTHYQQWPNSSVVKKVNETHVKYYVTPTTDLCEKFTWHDYWPNASMVINATETNLTIQHTPEVGSTYTPPSRFPGQSSSKRTVIEVAEEKIYYRRDNPHPLAGTTLVFDVSVLSAKASSGSSSSG